MQAVVHGTRASLVSRGLFLKVLGGAVLWPWLDADPLLAAVNDVVSQTPAGTPLELQQGSAGWFRRQLNTTFLARTDTGARVELRLVSIADGPASPAIEQFSLIFHAQHETTELHGTCACDHRTLGQLDLFLVPIGITNRRPRVYEACFSRFLSSGVEG